MILITGGAGHVVKQDIDIIVIDNLSTGFQKTIDALENIKNFEFVNLDLKEFDKVEYTKMKEKMKLEPKYNYLRLIIKSVYKWEKN